MEGEDEHEVDIGTRFGTTSARQLRQLARRAQHGEEELGGGLDLRGDGEHHVGLEDEEGGK